MIHLLAAAANAQQHAAQEAAQHAAQYGGALSGQLGAAFVRMLLVLGAMVLLLGLLAWGVRRLRGIKSTPAARQGKAIEVVERVQVDARHAICLVNVAGDYYVFGTGERGMSALVERPLDRHAVEAALGEAKSDNPSSKPAFLKLLRGDDGDDAKEQTPA